MSRQFCQTLGAFRAAGWQLRRPRCWVGGAGDSAHRSRRRCARLEKLVAGGGTHDAHGTRRRRQDAARPGAGRWRAEHGEVVPFAHLADMAADVSDDAIAAALGYESVEAAVVGLAEHPASWCSTTASTWSSGATCRRDAARMRARASWSSPRAGCRSGSAVSSCFPWRRSGCRHGRSRRGGGTGRRAVPRPGPCRGGHARAGRRGCSPTSGSCAAGSTGCRWRSSSPRPAPGRSPPPTSSRSSMSASASCAERTSSGDRHDSMRAAIEVSTSLLSAARADVLPTARGVHRVVRPGARPRRGRRPGRVVGWRRSTCSPRSSTARSSRPRRSIGHPVSPAGAAPRAPVDALHRAGELANVEERFVEAMAVVADNVVAGAMERWGPAMLTVGDRAVHESRASDRAVHRTRRGARRAFGLCCRCSPRCTRAPVGSLGDRLPCAATVARRTSASAGRGARRGGHRGRTRRSTRRRAGHGEVVTEDPAASHIAVAFAERAWGLAAREDDPADAARTSAGRPRPRLLSGTRPFCERCR